MGFESWRQHWTRRLGPVEKQRCGFRLVWLAAGMTTKWKENPWRSSVSRGVNRGIVADSRGILPTNAESWIESRYVLVYTGDSWDHLNVRM